MAATHTVTLYAVVVVMLLFALAAIVIHSRRELHMRVIAIGLALIAAPVVWFVFSELPGKPDDISTEEFRAKYRCATIFLYPSIKERVGIFMLVQRKEDKEPEYLFVEWNLKLASSLQKSVRTAKLNAKSSGTIIYGGKKCTADDDGGSGQGGEKGGKGKKGKRPEIRLPGGDGDGEPSGEDDFAFYPDPVPPNEVKNYEESEREPITLPPRR